MMQTAERAYGPIFLIATAVLVAAALLGHRLDPRATLVVLVAGVVVLGLPHGALDPMVARMALKDRGRFNGIMFYTIYVSVVLAYAMLWLGFPTAGLSGFLLVSTYHFGSDWYPRGSTLTRCAYGLTLVTLPAMLHGSDVVPVFALLGTAHAQALVDVSRALAPIGLIAAGVGAILQFKRSRRDLVEFSTIVLGAIFLEPLVFFTCYFCLLHSPRHLLETARGLGIGNLKTIAVKSLPVLIATLALGSVLYLCLPAIPMTERIIMVVFIGLAALTMPHMLLDTLTMNVQKRRMKLPYSL
jgi:Brp/Blh family beta-carotene 15,15'-monooxygenase